MLKNLVNLSQYPIDDQNTEAASKLIASCRESIRADGICILENFVSPDTLLNMQQDANACYQHAFRRSNNGNIYLTGAGDESFPERHPRRRCFPDSSSIAPYDLIPKNSMIEQLYRSEELRIFCAAILDKDKLFLNECEYQAINLVYYDSEDFLKWHFDVDNTFTVNLLLQESAVGGEFEVACDIRSDEDPAYEKITQVLDGDKSLTRSYQITAGSLVIFRGKNSLHRVTPISGDTRRTMMVMCYEDHPGVVGNPRVNATIYGPRVADKIAAGAAL